MYGIMMSFLLYYLFVSLLNGSYYLQSWLSKYVTITYINFL